MPEYGFLVTVFSRIRTKSKTYNGKYGSEKTDIFSAVLN